MAITTYSGLQSSIAGFLNREDLASVIPDFIALAEADMQRNVRHYEMEQRANLTIDGQYIDLPTDWLETVRLSIGTDALELISQSELLDRAEENEGTAGQPRFYALTAGQIEVFPIPDTAETGTLVYFKRFDALSDSNASNWVLANHPDAYLYGSLIHSAPYLQEDPRLQVWASMYQNALDAINRVSRRARMSGTGLKMKVRAY
jgi:hypothetical protein